MFGNEAVKMEWFHEGPSPKAKLNWFLYEVALEYHNHIMSSKALWRYRKTQNEAEIAKFCAYFAKRMKKSVLERLAGLTDATEIDEEYISDYYPDNSGKMNGLLLETACRAWDKLLSVCANCPTRCLSEKERYCTLFDTYTS
jgi:uncharacterized Fe-S radical SAM superfamily protein PflX